MSSHRLIVETPAQARRRKLLMVLLGAVILVAGWGLYFLGRVQAPSEVERVVVAQQEAELDKSRLRAENRRLKAENRQLSEQLTLFERSAEVDRVASSELRGSLQDMQSKVTELEKELAFYRGIVSPEDAEAGLRVQNFGVFPSGEERLYRFRLTLIQSMRQDGEVEGQVRVRLEGMRDGERVQLAWPEVALEPDQNLVFSFKHFQELGAAFRMPGDLEPTLVKVTVLPGGNAAGEVTETYRWQEIVKARS